MNSGLAWAMSARYLLLGWCLHSTVGKRQGSAHLDVKCLNTTSRKEGGQQRACPAHLFAVAMFLDGASARARRSTEQSRPDINVSLRSEQQVRLLINEQVPGKHGAERCRVLFLFLFGHSEFKLSNVSSAGSLA